MAPRSDGVLLAVDPERTREALLTRCHRRLAGTRGAALTVVVLDAPARRLTWIGVGNVEAALVGVGGTAGPHHHAPLVGGIVGSALPALRTSTAAVAPGDRVVIATDGLGADAAATSSRAGTPQTIADEILERCASASDDALVLVAQLLPRPDGGP